MASDRTDPFEVLRLPDEPIMPSERFAETLRTRIERAFGVVPSKSSQFAQATQTTQLTQGDDMSTNPKTAPGLLTITPYLCVRGAAEAISFYADVFGAVEEGERYVDESDGRIGHAQLRIGDSALMISDEYPDYGVGGPATFGGTTVALQIYVNDLDDAYAKAVAAGADGQRPPSDQFYGRSATIIDPWGHRWSMQMVVEDRALPTLEGFEVVEKAPIVE
jgi:PhnB protein